jgi:abnormal spindle-like microcephaly-associated protein
VLSEAGVIKSALVFKSTRDAVAAFSKEFLSKEGNVFQHLEKDMGISLVYQQMAIDEYDYTINALIPDLQNGVVLARLVELVTLGKKVLLPKLRVPTVSRLQKIHNVSVVLDELRSVRVTDFSKEMTKKTAEMVVEGNRDQIISLIVSIVHGLQLPSLINTETVQQEIGRLRYQRASEGHLNPHILLADTPAKLLLQWSATIAQTFGFKVDNFTTSFANGQVLAGKTLEKHESSQEHACIANHAMLPR